MIKTKHAILAILTISFATIQARELVWPTETKGIFFKKFGPPIESVQTPDGFTVTPADVSAMFAPRTIKIMIYADENHYFVTRYDRHQTMKKAQLRGVRISGKTGSVEKQGLGLKVTQPYQPTTLPAVVCSLAEKLSGIASKYPELSEYKATEANRGSSLFYSHNFVYPNGKRGIKDSDFGKNGCLINFSTGPIPPQDRVYAMTEPTLKLENLGLFLWTEIRTGTTPSDGFQAEIEGLLNMHAEMLQAIDSQASGTDL